MNEATPQLKKEELTIQELRLGLTNGMTMDQMPRYILLNDGRRLDVSLKVDADLLKSLIRGNRHQRRAKAKVGRKT